MRRRLFLMAAGLALLAAADGRGDEPADKGLTICWVDVEGGAATLIVTPAGESLLIDCGNPGKRDADRIHQAATRLGLRAIDHLVITHWHLDHYGGVERLSELLPIRHFWDRGIPDTLAEDPKNFPLLIRAYRAASKGQSKPLRPGDEVPLRQAAGTPPVRLRCLCAAGAVVAEPPHAVPNPAARAHKPQPPDPSDNAKSLGFLLSYGAFRFLDLGDLTWNVEYQLVHPSNKIGPVDVYQSTHHGLEISNNPVVINSVQPRVAVFNNGPRKGCHPSVTATLRRVPGLQAIYQLHRNVTVGTQENTDPAYIANDGEKCQGEPVLLRVAADGTSYEVTAGGKGKPHRYATRGAE